MLHPFSSSPRQLVLLAAGAVVLVALAIAPGASADASHTTRPAARQASVGLGPAGGYTPEDLSVAYQFSPAVSRTGQLVAVVSWFDDPKIRANLTTFDHEYGIRADTASSFRVVDQAGKKSPLPSSSKGKHTSQQTATQVEAVRGVCNTCRIVLVEAKSGSLANIAAAERTAGRLGATVIVNALATPEKEVSTSVRKAFTQPGVVITAPAGDRGWYGMDAAFDSGGTSVSLPSFPASDPSVVAVGGTTLALNNDGSRAEEFVWNADGKSGATGISSSRGLGATGGGCSKRYAAAAFQRAAPGYSAAGCSGKRLVADVAADADSSFGGLDVYDSWGHSGWLTTGGDGLATALVGGMYALAGGAPGAVYPADAAYENSARFP
ncbi:MAG TPA: hypothetical protein VH085_08185, partial [Nocardioides sp.]|nr:hypothetical protein [Nocardioides sp.]